MQKVQLNFYKIYGLTFGGNKFPFDEIYIYLLNNNVVKRKAFFKGFRSEWYWKIIDGKVMHKLPHLVEWQEYYFKKEDFNAEDWEVVSEEELSFNLEYMNL
jgi:hypothetical protein